MRIWPRIAWSLLGLAIYAPIPLLAAFPSLTPPILQAAFSGLPGAVAAVATIIVTIVVLTWICGAVGEADDPPAAKKSAEQGGAP